MLGPSRFLAFAVVLAIALLALAGLLGPAGPGAALPGGSLALSFPLGRWSALLALVALLSLAVPMFLGGTGRPRTALPGRLIALFLLGRLLLLVLGLHVFLRLGRGLPLGPVAQALLLLRGALGAKLGLPLRQALGLLRGGKRTPLPADKEDK